MQITFKPYKRRDGSLMLYVNRSNRVSVGISPERGFSPYGKGVSQGERNAVQAAIGAVRKNGLPFTGDLNAHSETGFCAAVECGPFILVGTDVGSIGGMAVGEDGAYVIHGGLIVRCGEALEEGDE